MAHHSTKEATSHHRRRGYDHNFNGLLITSLLDYSPATDRIGWIGLAESSMQIWASIFTVQNRSCYWRYLFEVELGISRTNADSQWNPVYNAFHHCCCGNERIRR